MRHAENVRNDIVPRMWKFNTKPFVQSNENCRVWFFVVNHNSLSVFNVPRRNGDCMIEYMHQSKVKYTLSLIALLCMIFCHIYITSIIRRMDMDNNHSRFSFWPHSSSSIWCIIFFLKSNTSRTICFHETGSKWHYFHKNDKSCAIRVWRRPHTSDWLGSHEWLPATVLV